MKIEELINRLKLTEANVNTMQENLKLLRKISDSSLQQLSGIIKRNNNRPLKSPTAVLKYEASKGTKGRINLSVDNVKRLYEYFYNIAYEKSKDGNYLLLNFLTVAFFFPPSNVLYEQKSIDIQNQLLCNFKEIIKTDAGKKKANTNTFFPDYIIDSNNITKWKLKNNNINEKPIDIWCSKDWKVPGCNPINFITNGDELRQEISRNIGLLIRNSNLSIQKVCRTLEISESGLRHFINHDSELSISQTIKVLEMIGQKEERNVNFTLSQLEELSYENLFLKKKINELKKEHTHDNILKKRKEECNRQGVCCDHIVSAKELYNNDDLIYLKKEIQKANQKHNFSNEEKKDLIEFIKGI